MNPRHMPPARLLNLLAPGTGLIVVGHVTAGLAVAVAFAICANVAVACNLIVPLESPALLRSLSVVAAALLYIVAQGLLMAAARGSNQQGRQVAQAQALARVREQMQAGDFAAAWAALEPWLPANSDLLVGLRAAQILTALGDVAAAREQLATLRGFDKHHICRAECAALEARLATDEVLHNPQTADAVSAATGR